MAFCGERPVFVNTGALGLFDSFSKAVARPSEMSREYAESLGALMIKGFHTSRFRKSPCRKQKDSGSLGIGYKTSSCLLAIIDSPSILPAYAFTRPAPAPAPTITLPPAVAAVITTTATAATNAAPAPTPQIRSRSNILAQVPVLILVALVSAYSTRTRGLRYRRSFHLHS